MAEKLLDEAGYPRGDGRHQALGHLHCTPRGIDVSWPELQAAYWRDVGVEVIIETPTDAEYSARGIKSLTFICPRDSCGSQG